MTAVLPPPRVGVDVADRANGATGPGSPDYRTSETVVGAEAVVGNGSSAAASAELLANPPKHVAIIMDGNGRWAEMQGLPRIEGHRRGAGTVRRITRHCRRLGVKALTLYAFSEQNWGRPKDEIVGLMKLLRDFIHGEWNEILNNGIRLVSIGQTERLPMFVRGPLATLERASAHNSGMILCLALSYGAREEIVMAARHLAAKVAAGEMRPQDITERSLARSLYSAVIPWEPDLLIRTSGELRLSNFLLWQAAYAELYFTETLWPDFGDAELDQALLAYRARQRRFGLVQAQRNAADTGADEAPLAEAPGCEKRVRAC